MPGCTPCMCWVSREGHAAAGSSLAFVGPPLGHLQHDAGVTCGRPGSGLRARAWGDLPGPLLHPQTKGAAGESGSHRGGCAPHAVAFVPRLLGLPGRRPLPSREPLPRPSHCPFLPLVPPPVPPTIEQGAEDTGTLVRRSGELVTLACPVRGSPPIRVSWLKDGLPLPLSQRTLLHGSGRVLR